MKHDIGQKKIEAEHIRKAQSDKKAEFQELEGLATELQINQSDLMKRIESLHSKRREKQVCGIKKEISMVKLQLKFYFDRAMTRWLKLH